MRLKSLKNFLLIPIFLTFFLPTTGLAAFDGDIFLAAGDVRFSSNTFLEGKVVRIYTTIHSRSKRDIRGVVRFFDGKEQIKGDQPISVLAQREDSVFVDWVPNAGDHTITVAATAFEEASDDPNNNTVKKDVKVEADTDRDGTPNKDDIDDDNDGVKDTEDSFPLDRSESKDSDGDRQGDNRDTDDDNDEVLDKDDAFPLDANESLDTDRDGQGNNSDLDDDGDGLNDTEETSRGLDPAKADSDGDGTNDREDLFPLDPTDSRDYDKDGVGDAKDSDADNDGIPKEQDTNDQNLGPLISLDKGSLFPLLGKPFTFDATKTRDPDGKVVTFEWEVDGKPVSPVPEKPGELTLTFDKAGRHSVLLRAIDDRGEKREETVSFTIYAPTLVLFLALWILVIIVLAFLVPYYYSKRRAPKRKRKAHRK